MKRHPLGEDLNFKSGESPPLKIFDMRGERVLVKGKTRGIRVMSISNRFFLFLI